MQLREVGHLEEEMVLAARGLILNLYDAAGLRATEQCHDLP